MQIGVHRHRRFHVHPWNRAKKRRTKACEYFVTYSEQENVAIAPTSACSKISADLILEKIVWRRPVRYQQFSFTLGPPEVCAGTNLCWRYTCSLLHWLQAKCRQHHLSENIGPAIARSARPAPPALYERNECVKETLSHWRLKQLQCR